MDLLLHICCAPCSIASWDYFSGSGYAPCGYFFNPNIHPYREFSRRLETLRQFAQSNNRSVVFDEDYRMEDFIRRVVTSGKARCELCYEMRLFETARRAKEMGLGYFSSTLLLSPYQDHELLQRTGEKVAEHYGVGFVYTDLRPRFRESMQKAREYEMYRQGYCGCIYSEMERYYRRK